MADQELKVTTAGEHEIHAERWFDAPRERVWQAFTDPELIPQWWGLRSTTTIVDELELRPGGKWRFVQRSDDGSETGFRGEYREIRGPESLTWTFEWEGMPGHISTETVTFTEQDGGTLVSTASVFDNREDRDGMVESGMEDGMRETYDRLAELLAKVRAA
jgi:uncharacterized protein YndB with AHSA1/START domain